MYHFKIWTVKTGSLGSELNLRSTVNSRFKKDLKLQIPLHKAFSSDEWLLDSLHKSFLNQSTFDLGKEKWTFLNRDFTVLSTKVLWLTSIK